MSLHKPFVVVEVDHDNADLVVHDFETRAEAETHLEGSDRKAVLITAAATSTLAIALVVEDHT